MPKITVITPTLNRRQWVRKCLRSVETQTFHDWEHIVYDVGTDTVADLIPDDPRVRYVKGECAGPAGDFQAALELATGDLVTPLSDDDRLPRHALRIATDLMDSTLCDWMNGRTVLVNETGDPLHLRGGTWDHVQDTRNGQYMLGGAVYWRKALSDEIGGFQSEFDGAGDVDLYGRFLRHSGPARTRQVLYIHTVHAAQDSIVNQRRQADAARRAVERSIHVPRPQAA